MGETADTPRARALSAALREALKASGVGVNELARRLSMTHTPISLWLNGNRVPNVETVGMILGALHMPPGDRERILELARNAKEPNWLTVGVSGIPAQLAGVVESERAASKITEWIQIGIPGLLQTMDYNRAIKQAGNLPRTDIELRVMVSASRSEVITRRKDPVQFTALMGESVLREVVGSPEIMVDQLRHLNKMADLPNVNVLIVPQGIGWHPGWSGPFILYEFPDLSPVVYFEHHSSGAFVPTEHDVIEYQKAIDWLQIIALSQSESSALITKAADEMENTT